MEVQVTLPQVPEVVEEPWIHFTTACCSGSTVESIRAMDGMRVRFPLATRVPWQSQKEKNG